MLFGFTSSVSEDAVLKIMGSPVPFTLSAVIVSDLTELSDGRSYI